MRKYRNFLSKVTVVAVVACLLLPCAGVVMASDIPEVPEPGPIEIEEIMDAIEIEPDLALLDSEGVSVEPNNPEDETPKESTPDPSVSENETVSGDETPSVNEVETPSNNEAETPSGDKTPSGSESSSPVEPQKYLRYYAQPEWYVNSGYDAVTAYVTDSTGAYVKRCFLITDGSEWLLYNYTELEAAEYFSKTEFKNGMYIPVQKKTARKNNSKTELDESKIPTLTMQAWEELEPDKWLNFSQIPFTRDTTGQIVYAGELEKSDDLDEPTPVPTPSSNLTTYTVTINNNVYKICMTESVSYCGKKHVLKTAKETKSQKPDVEVLVHRNEELVSTKDYTVKFYNNTNVNGYGKSSVVPYLTINLKKGADKKLLASNRFGFDILPVDIGTLSFSVKKVTYSSSTGKLNLNNPKVKIDGIIYKLTPRGAKNRLTGSYVAGYRDGKVILYGVNNFAGKKEINLSLAKTIDWSF